MLAGSWKVSFALPSKHPDAEGRLRSLLPSGSAASFLTTHSRNGITHSDILLLLSSSSYHQHLQIELWAWPGLSVCKTWLLHCSCSGLADPVSHHLSSMGSHGAEQGSPSLGQRDHIWHLTATGGAVGRGESKGKALSSLPSWQSQASKTKQHKEPESCGQYPMKRLLIQKKVIQLGMVCLWHYRFFLRNSIKREKKCVRRDIKSQSEEKLGKYGSRW